MMVIEKSGKDIEKIYDEVKKEHGTNCLFVVASKKKKILKDNLSINLITYDELAIELAEFLKELIENMNIEGTIEYKIDDSIIYLNIDSNNNNILIGKNGRTLKALETIIKQKIFVVWESIPKIILNVGNYREKRESQIIRLAKKTAREVKYTKIDATLENMNAYERRIIHNTISEYEKLTTESVGEEPNRHIIIKYKR